MSTKADYFIASQMPALLAPGELVHHTAHVVQPPGFFLRVVLFGGLLASLFTRRYFAVATSHRLLLIRTRAGLFGRPKLRNEGVEAISLSSLQGIETGGWLNNRSMTLVDATGAKRTLRIAVWSRAVTGQRAFFEQLPATLHRALPAGRALS